MKSITNKIALLFFVMLFSSTVIQAQEIIKDSVITPVKKSSNWKKIKDRWSHCHGWRLYHFRF
jgi:peptidyl-prolyl cis-trans isomerase SurA